MRKKIALLNSIFGIIYMIVSALEAIVVRKYFISVLGEEFLGLTAIFTSIFGILIALDCGVSSSVFFKIYKPLNNNDEDRIASTFHLIKKVYTIRAISVLAVGIIAIAFLPFLVRGSSFDINFINKAYLIYMGLTVASYLVIFYSFFLDAIQKRYVSSIISIVTYSICAVIQVILLKTAKSYYIYIVLSLLQPVLSYIICRTLAYKYYPFLKSKKRIFDEDKRDFKSLLGMAFHAMSAVIASYTDSFLITGFTGVATLGLYDNYRVISSKVSALLDQITASIKDPMRSLLAEENKEYAENILNMITFFVFFVAGNGSILFSTLINPFIGIWLGDRYRLGFWIAIVSGLTMLLSALNYILVDTYYYVRAYEYDKKTPIIEIITNIFISFLLGMKLGIVGVLIGTIFHYMVQFLMRGFKLYKSYFKKSFYICFIRYLSYIIYSFIIMLFCVIVTQVIMKIYGNILAIIGGIILELSVFNFSLCLIYRKDNRFLYFKEIISGLLKRLKVRGGKRC